MPWVTFTQDFDWSPPSRRGQIMIAYKAGTKLLVTQDCANAAITAGKAHPVQTEVMTDGKRQPRKIPQADE